MRLWPKIKLILFGKPLNPGDPAMFHNLSLIAFFAWVGLGSDGLSSSCYGPEEAFTALGVHTHLSLFVALLSVLTIIIISTSYSQIIELFPGGGGGYLVASRLLSPTLGMVSGCTLLVDYVLTITLSIASGADALFSFFPTAWLPYKLIFAIAGVIVLTTLNIRGVKESVLPLVPIFLLFLATHLFVIGYTFATHLMNFADVVSKTTSDLHQTRHQMGTIGMLIIILRSYSMGAGTFTGIEAVSNGLPILREPKVTTAKHTMKYMAASLSIMVVGLMLSYLLFEVERVPGKTLNAVLVERMTGSWDSGYADAMVFITLVSEAVLLFVAAQTGFLDGPRVIANMAIDRWFPTRFALLSDRLVTKNGILIMSVAALILMILSNGSVRFLVVLYSINVFATFVLSQLGMVRHWITVRKKERSWLHRLLINGLGLLFTGFILASVTILKFDQGGWITIFITGSLIVFVVFVKRHYEQTFRLIKRLDELIAFADEEIEQSRRARPPERRKKPRFDPSGKTAVLLVNGFSGLGLHSLLKIFNLFGDLFSNFVLLQVGLVDAGVFKSGEEIEGLMTQIDRGLDRYIEFLAVHGYYAERHSSLATDVVAEVLRIAPAIQKKYPRCVFFGGQLVFPEETFFTRLLHNYTTFAMQKKLYARGIPFILLPVKV